MPRLLALPLVAALLLLATPAGAAGAPRDRCRPADGETLERTASQVRILSSFDPSTTLACHRATGRRTELFTQDEKYGTGSVAALSGRWVAASYSEEVGCAFPGCGEPSEVTAATTLVVDARTGRRRVLTDGTTAPLRLRADGVVVWLTGAEGARELHVWDARGSRVLDTGAIALADVRLRGAVRWTRDGTVRSAAVRGLGR